ncbi:MAG: hypothetical protein B7Z73_13210, partial [Planctomycetia bacterium 21-64-5]
SADERFRAAAALAGLAAHDDLWAEVTPFVGETLAKQEPKFLNDWIDSLRPVGKQLIDPLCSVFHAADRGPLERSNAAIALAEFSGDDLPRLTRLVLEADARQFAAILPKLTGEPNAAVPLLQQAVTESPSPQWDDGAKACWPDAPPQAVSQVIAADGLCTASLALCQTMPLSTSVEVAEALRSSGYRPICFRPYTSPDDVRVAAAWRRDGVDWRLATDKTAEQLRALNVELHSQGYLPVDVADYFPAAAADDASRRFAALWSKGQRDLADAQLYLMVPAVDHPSAWGPLNSAGFVPRSNLRTVDRKGEEYFSSVRWKLCPAPGYGDDWNIDESGYERRLAEGRCQTDVRLTGLDELGGQVRFAACWWSDPELTSQETHGLRLEEHLQKCRRLADQGYRPAAVSVGPAPDSGRVWTASVWHRPVLRQVDRDRCASRQANAAITLCRLGRTDQLWPQLIQHADPRLRTYLIHRLAGRGAGPELLIDRLAIETDDSARRAVLLALSRFEPSELPAEQRATLIDTATKLYQDHPDPGVHAAAEFLLRSWQTGKALQVPAVRPRQTETGEEPSWFVNGQGQTMVVVRGPVTYSMGTEHEERGRDRSTETFHRQRIGRSFAVGAKEVTLEQFLRFDPSHSASSDHAPDRDCPAINVSWYAAARYCRWLSEQLGDDAPVWLMPCRLLRRKNLAEALLLARWLRPEA